MKAMWLSSRIVFGISLVFTVSLKCSTQVSNAACRTTGGWSPTMM